MFSIFDLFTLTAVKTNFAKQRICSVVHDVVGVFLPAVPSHFSPFKKEIGTAASSNPPQLKYQAAAQCPT